jgi:hypothetical protein
VFLSSFQSETHGPLVTTLYNVTKAHQLSATILEHLNSPDSALSIRQYYRLMAMSMTLGIWGVVWISLNIQVVVSQGSYPRKAIHARHFDIIELPTTLLGPEFVHQSYLLWWGVPAAALLFFLLFGTSYDVLYEYMQFWAWLRTTVLRQPLRDKGVSISTRYAFLFIPSLLS